jgi:predicted ribosome quality control (RQC) complex YloA/Tae2 family protein
LFDSREDKDDFLQKAQEFNQVYEKQMSSLMPKRRELFIVKQSKANQRKSRMMKSYEWFNSSAPVKQTPNQ